MNIVKIGSKVEDKGVEFSPRLGCLSQSFKVLDVNALRGWRVSVLSTHMFAIASHRFGLSW